MGQYRGKPKVNVSRHDHVGSMVFDDVVGSAACRGCGQLWDWDEKRGWVALHFRGRG